MEEGEVTVQRALRHLLSECERSRFWCEQAPFAKQNFK